MTRAPRASRLVPSRLVALALVAFLALPTLAVTAGCGSKNNASDQTSTSAPAPTDTTMNTQPNARPAKAGLSTKQKVVLLAGAALLYYMYTRYKKQDQAAAAGGAKPQLYREDKGPNKGAIYYRKNDANHTVVWLQAPAGGVQVPADQAQQALGNGFNPNNPSAYQPPEQINPNPQNGVNGGSVQSADQYAGAAQ